MPAHGPSSENAWWLLERRLLCAQVVYLGTNLCAIDTEIKALAKARAPQTALFVYQALCMHDWERSDGFVFPSITRIYKLLCEAFHTNSIHRALKWLEDHGFIERGHFRSRRRFKLLFRNLAERASGLVKSAKESNHTENRSTTALLEEHKRKKRHFFKRRSLMQRSETV